MDVAMGLSRNLVVIGSSTGGVRALDRIFSGLPRLNAAIVIVHHMPKFINGSLGCQLNANTDMEVKVAEDGEILEHGKVYLAPSNVHLRIEHNSCIRLVGGEKVNFVCPSIDVTMRSLRKELDDQIVGVVLTGMGVDGVSGTSHIKRIGGLTIAQDEATSAIYGMPKAAYKTGDVDLVLTPERIQDKLIEIVGIPT